MQFAAKPYNRRGLSTEYDFKKREGYDGDTTSENRHGQVTFKVNKPKITTEKLSNSNEQRKLTSDEIKSICTTNQLSRG